MNPIASDLDGFGSLHPANSWLGECPTWDAANGLVWWIDWTEDYKDGRIHSLDLQASTARSYRAHDHIGCIALCAEGRIAVARSRDIAMLEPETGDLEIVATAPLGADELWFKDGKVDAAGRLWVGTISETMQGRLYCYNPSSGNFAVKDSGFGTSNGLGWSPDNKTFYFTDSQLKRIYAYDFELASGEIANRRIFHDFSRRPPDSPDGLAVDCEGFVWTALWDGYCVARISPAGRIVEELPISTQRVSSVTFAGESLDKLIATSASVGCDPQASSATIKNGDLAWTRSAVPGLPSHPLAL